MALLLVLNLKTSPSTSTKFYDNCTSTGIKPNNNPTVITKYYNNTISAGTKTLKIPNHSFYTIQLVQQHATAVLSLVQNATTIVIHPENKYFVL